MAVITTKEKNKLYRHIKHELGYPIRKFELKDEMLDSYFEMALEDYSSYLNSWLITQQWVGLQGLDIEEADLVNALTTKSNDFMKSFTFAYSKQTGVLTNAPAGNKWELKRDFITISAHTQHYIIPANREVNEVLWETPPEIDQGLIDPFAVSNFGMSNGLGFTYLGRPAQYVQPTYSLLLQAQDRRLKQNMLQSNLTYRITGLADGRKLLHLYPVPAGRNEIRGRWGKHLSGRKVWYFYYSTTDENRNKCLEENSDIIRLPSDVPLDDLEYGKLNDTARTHVRNLFLARTMMSIGNIRGFFSGEVGIEEKTLTMDYRQLLDRGKELRDATKEEVMLMLENLSLLKLTQDRASIAEAVNRERQYQPFRSPIHVK